MPGVTATADRSMRPSPSPGSAASSYQNRTEASASLWARARWSPRSGWSAGERSACSTVTGALCPVFARCSSIESIGVQPMPAEASRTGAPESSRTRSPYGAETRRVSPARTRACRWLETSPSGPAAAGPWTRLTVIARTGEPGEVDRLYWRIWRAPSGSSTCTETYWPGRCAGAGAPSAGVSRKVVQSAVSSVRPVTVHSRHTSPAVTCRSA